MSASEDRGLPGSCDASSRRIGLLVVVVIIGIVASIAVPKFANRRERAYLATMKGDLRNLAVSQEAYFYDNSLYYDGPLPDRNSYTIRHRA